NGALVPAEVNQARGDGISEENRWLQFRGDLNNTGYSSSSVPASNKDFLAFSTGWKIQSSPVYRNGIIYFGSQSMRVYAVEASTGEKVWEYETGGVVDSTPVIHEDTLYVGSSDSNLYALNATSGDFLWSFDTDGEIISSPKYYNGIIYFGSKDGNFYAVNVSNESHHWSFPFKTGGEIWGSAAIADDRVFFGSGDLSFYSLWLENGSEDWNFSIEATTTTSLGFSSPAVYGGRVIVGSDDMSVYCLDEFTGKMIWSFATHSQVYSSPAVHNETVFVASYDSIYALPLEDPNKDGKIDSSEVIWQVPFVNSEGGSSPAIAEGKVLIGSTSSGLLCLNESDGSHFWNFSIPSGTVSSPTVVDGKVFIGGGNGIMYGLGSSGLPSLHVEIIPEYYAIKSNRVMGIVFRVTHDQEPVEGAFVNLYVSEGELTQQGASTFSDGTNRIKYTAPTVQENTTVTITAVAKKAKFEEGRSSVQVIVEPSTSYGNLSSETEFPWHKYLGYIVAVVALAILNLAVAVQLLKKKEGEVP
ncbi:MAG: PQQ-binding-like beta-propeller repeat protein, partial [Thermoplasmata archaeon]